MKHTIKTLEAALKVIASKFKTRKAFNRAVGKVFKPIDKGAFREVFDGGTFAIKLRKVDACGSCFDMDDIDASNEMEAQNYADLMDESPEVAFFVLAPIYICLPNGHDAILMRRVSVASDHAGFLAAMAKNDAERTAWDLEDYITQTLPQIMVDQYEFIRQTFADSHDNNIGWDRAAGRVWYIDYNHGANTGESDRDSRCWAKKVMKRVTQSNRKAAAR